MPGLRHSSRGLLRVAPMGELGPTEVPPPPEPIEQALDQPADSLEPYDPLAKLDKPIAEVDEIRRQIESRAIDLHDQAGLAEPRITPDIEAAAAETGGTRLGEAHVVKSVESIARKLTDAVASADSPTEAAAEFPDAVRYTLTYPAESYTAGVEKTIAGLTGRGYRMDIDSIQDAWQPGNRYKGLNAEVLSPDGQRFELQFHTPESYQVAQQTHPDYELLRTSTNTLERRAAFDRMVEVSSHLVHPPGVERIGQPRVHRRP
jgi:hypothetical protein